jgi:hypothetical protein
MAFLGSALDSTYWFSRGSRDELLQTFAVIWDTGATLTVTPHRDDFVEFESYDNGGRHVLKGLAKGLTIGGAGVVAWSVVADNGDVLTIRTPAYLVPEAGQRLLSPQSFLQSLVSQDLSGSRPSISIGPKALTVEMGAQSKLTVPYDEGNNLPTSQMFSVEFQAVQTVLKSGVLGRTPLIMGASKCEHPKCASCQYGKGRRRATGASSTKSVPAKEGALKSSDLFPGQRVSMDHFKVTHKGRLYESKGKSLADTMYSGGLIFVDHASGYVHVELCVNFTAGETLRAKALFEQAMLDHGITVQSYQTDNGVFAAKEFMLEIHNMQQSIGFSGVGAHHQNGVAKQSIGTIMVMARTLMLHAAIRWPDVSDACYWPMAVDYAVYQYNHGPKLVTTAAPIDLLLKTMVPRHRLHDLHVWGCPAYVLDPKLQDGQKIPKWSPRSRRGVFLGLSRKHSSTVPLILNCETLTISPQFHVVFDDWFSSVLSMSAEEPFDPNVWTEMFVGSRYKYFFDADDPVELDAEWLSEREKEVQNIRDREDRVRPQLDLRDGVPKGPKVGTHTTDLSFERENRATDMPLQLPPTTPIAVLPTTGTEEDQFPISDPSVPESPSSNKPPSILSPSKICRETPRSPPPPEPEPRVRFQDPPPKRESRHRRPPRRFGYDGSQGHGYLSKFSKPDTGELLCFIGAACNLIRHQQSSSEADLAYRTFCESDFETETFNFRDPLAFAASTKRHDPDTPNYHEAMCGPDSEGYQEAMAKEIKALERHGTWTLVPKSSIPKGRRALPSTWAFKKKRFPDGMMRKLKARFCVRGDQQVEGVDYFESYAPVVSWTTVRLLLSLSIIFGLETRQVDYSNAFAQAKLDEEIYVQLPRGFQSPDPNAETVMKLNRSLYGLVQAPLKFFEHLKSHLEKRGFVSTEIDPCLFIHKDMVCLVYVDDCLFFARDGTKIETMIASLQQDFELTVEGDVSAFLGIQFERDTKAGTIKLTQHGLIDRVIKATGLEECNSDRSPAATDALGKDVEGEPMTEDWSYASVVGMLLYLASNSRPEIAFAVHQCARFTHAPKKSHAQAVKRICRYLKGTNRDGLILKPTGELAIDCYVDADFAGLWKREDDQDPMCAKSRTGFVFTIAGCPLIWVSKMQTEIALSTMESEYVALSQAMRELIPLCTLVEVVHKGMGLAEQEAVTRVYSKVFEDNNGALTLANVPRMMPQSRHYAVKYHFFREYVRKGDIQILPIDTKVQLADCMTKGLPWETFSAHRKLLCGW